MSMKSKDIIVGLLFFLGLLLLTWSVMAVNIYYYNHGDTMKWGSKNGAFLIGMFFSFPFVLLLSLGNYLALLFSRKWFEVLNAKLKVVVEIVSASTMYLLLYIYWTTFLDFLIDSYGLIIVAIGFVISLILLSVTILISRLTSASS